MENYLLYLYCFSYTTSNSLQESPFSPFNIKKDSLLPVRTSTVL
ncbi:MAG TPA: hypothetical protein VK645_00915 [Chitinophagaceae bacterium]|nr:hypothetical protein [Chitinophagaceae bacterium]